MNRIFSLSGAILLGVCFLITISSYGQSPAASNLPPQQADNGFFKIQREFNEYWAPYNVDNKGYYVENGVRKKAGGWKQFKRWEWFWENRIDPVSGEFPKVSAADIYEQLGGASTRSSEGSWTSMGPNSSGGGYAGIGRLNCVVEQPITGDLYAGSPSGGVWKSTNGGSDWDVLTDDNAVLGVSSIVVVPDPGNDDIIYIGTGDRDGGSMWSLSGGQSNDNNSIGVLKSTDGGSTWFSIGPTFSPSQKETINRLVLDHSDNSTIYAATSAGIYKTIDAGANWTLLASGPNLIDLEMHPTNSSILYMSTMDYWNAPAIYKTTDGGSNWIAVATFPDTDYRVELAVTPADDSRVYAVVANQDGALSSIQRSTDAGDNFGQVFGSGTNMLGWFCLGTDANGQGGYDLCIAADPNNANTVFVGGVNTWKSTNGGSSWSNNNMWTSHPTYNSCGSPVAHADKHDLVYFGSKLYECNDGGLYITENSGNSWTDLTDGMVITQIYRLSVSQTSSTTVMTGLQDNGSKEHLSGTWYDRTGGDGMECLIDYSNVNTQYSTYPRGDITRTTTHWGGTSDVTPGSAGTGAWVTPFVIDPNTNTTLYAGYEDVWKSTNRGTSWTMIGNLNYSTYYLRSLAVAPSNSNYIYAASRDELQRTTNGGSSWSIITGSLPVSSSYITYVSVNEDDPDIVWVSMGEYNAHGVYETTDGGSTWTDISAGLPNIPVMCVIQNKQNTSDNELYAATDLGVYAKVGSSNWFAFNSGLPNVVVTELEIYYDGTPSNSLLRAATFGRGLWESDLWSAATTPPVADFSADNLNPQDGLTVNFTDFSSNIPTSWSWSFSPSTVTYVGSTSSSSQNPQVQFDAAGLYTVTLQATNAFGSDTEVKTDYIDVYACNGINNFPYTETFDSWTTNTPAAACTPDASVLLESCWTNITGDNIDWNIFNGSTASGGTGPTSDHTGGGNYLYAEASGCYSNTGRITSPGFDLSGITDPELTFWYHLYGAGMGSLSVQVSTNGGSSWSSNIWSLSGDQGNSWQEVVLSLNAYTTETELIIRFTAVTGSTYQSDIAIDDFSITGIGGPTPQDQITSFDGGWNISSFYVTPSTVSMINLFQPLIDNSTLVKISDEAGGFVQYITGPGWMNTIGDMNNTEGYYINLTAAGSLTTNGTLVTYPFDIPLIAGWNIMSYPCEVSQVAMTVLQPVIDDGYLVKVLSESGGIIQFVTGLGWINTIVNFVPGEGYYINVNTITTLSLADPAKSALPQTFPEPEKPTDFFAYQSSNPFAPMNIVIRDILTDGFKVEDGDEIAVFDGDIQVGSSVISADGKAYHGIIARTDDPLTEMTDGFTKGNEITFKLWDRSEDVVYSNIQATHLDGDKEFNSLGTYYGDLKVSSLGDGEFGLPASTFLGQNYPNPYSEKTRINYGIAEDAVVTISVYDVSGRAVMVLQNSHMPAGTYHIEMSKASLEAGIYYYSMKVNGKNTNFSETRKMILF